MVMSSNEAGYVSTAAITNNLIKNKLSSAFKSRFRIAGLQTA